MKSGTREIADLKFRLNLISDRRLGSKAFLVPVNFESDPTFLNRNLATSRLCNLIIKRPIPIRSLVNCLLAIAMLLKCNIYSDGL